MKPLANSINEKIVTKINIDAKSFFKFKKEQIKVIIP